MISAKHRITACSLLIAVLFPLTIRTARARQAASAYEAFKAQLQWTDFKPLFISHETFTSGPQLKGFGLFLLQGDWQKALKAWPDITYQPVMAFHFDRNHDAYLTLSPSLLNGTNGNLLIFDSGGRLMASGVVAGDYGDEGYYTTTFGWIRDLNNDRQLDLLLRVQTTRPSEDASRKVYATDKLSSRIWTGKSFKDDPPKARDSLKLETDQDVGTFRLETIRQWDSDPRAMQAAIRTYEDGLEPIPAILTLLK
jgi:hypothetical protein